MLTASFQAGRDQYECVIPFVPAGAVNGHDAALDIADRWNNHIRAGFRGVLGADIFIRGVKIEGMVRGFLLPSSEVYDPASFPGLVAGESYSPNTSMLIVFYASDQTDLNPRRYTAKTFVGPPPESKCHLEVLLDAFVAGALTDLANLLLGPFNGATSGVQWFRALNVTRQPGDFVNDCDMAIARPYLVTQKRRLTPRL